MSLQPPSHGAGPQPQIPHGQTARIVLGLGLRASATSHSLQGLWLQASQRLACPAFAAAAVLQAKAAHPALQDWLAQLPFEALLVPIAPAQLPGQAVATHSARLQARYGTGSVAEAAALAAAGPSATLILPRLVSQDGCATLAAALAAGDSMERVDNLHAAALECHRDAFEALRSLPAPGCRQEAARRNRPISLQPFGTAALRPPGSGAACGVANPRNSTAMAAVWRAGGRSPAPYPAKSLSRREESVNTFFNPISQGATE